MEGRIGIKTDVNREMALEVWDPSTRKLNGPWDMTPVFQTIYPPAGQGWRATNPKKVGLATQYTWVRDVPDPVKPDPAPAPAVPAPPISLPSAEEKASTNTTSSEPTETSKPPVQDFKLEEQAAAQKNYIDSSLEERMKKFQNLLNSLAV